MCLGKCVFCLDVLLTSMRRLQCPVCYAAVMSNTTQDKDKFEDAKGVIRSRKSKIEAVNLRYQRGNQKP